MNAGAGRPMWHGWRRAAATHGGKIEEAAMAALRKGWYLGEESFKDKLLGMVDKARAKIRRNGHHSGGAVAAHNKQEAERIIRLTAGRLGLPLAVADLAKLRKGDPGKVACAALVRLRTAMPNDWVAGARHGWQHLCEFLGQPSPARCQGRRALAAHERALDTECKAPEK